MPPVRLQTFAHVAGLTFYLDTSAVLPLAFAETGEPIEEREERRCNLLKPFLERATRAGSRVVCSVLVFEEIAALVRNQQQRDILDREREHFRSWKDYERSNPAKADAGLRTVHATMLTMLQHAADALHKVGVNVAHPVGDPVADFGRKLRKAHRGYLHSYPRLDAMDALHLTFGAYLNCRHFVSFDKAWADVTEIQLLN